MGVVKVRGTGGGSNAGAGGICSGPELPSVDGRVCEPCGMGEYTGELSGDIGTMIMQGESTNGHPGVGGPAIGFSQGWP